MIKEIKERFEQLANSHKMISDFLYNDKFSIERTGNDKYPLFFLEDDPTISYTNSVVTSNWTFYIIDIPKEDQTDYLDLQDKIEEINRAFVLKFQLEYDDLINTTTSIDSVFLKEWNSDNTCAIRTEISFTHISLKNNCLEPWN